MKFFILSCLFITLFALVKQEEWETKAKETKAKETKATDDQLNGDDCGVSNIQRILNGTDTRTGNFPWTAAIVVKSNNTLICGGAIISKDIILTAARCVLDDLPNSEYAVRVGSLRYRDGGQVYDVSRRLRHPQFDVASLNNDIALLKLSKPIPSFTSTVAPLCVSKFVPNNVEGIIIGWGATSTTSPYISSTLKRTNVTIFICPASGRDNQVCAGGLGRDICNGDIGAPLMMPFTDASNINHWYSVGVASFYALENCTQGNMPSVYTNVPKYYTWITQGIAELNMPILPETCGQSNFQYLIAGGTPAGTGNWPWMAAITSQNNLVCGGAIITKNIILTAAQCIDGNNFGQYLVRVGSLNYNEGGQTFRLKTLLKPSAYNSDGTRKNDLALLKLERPIPSFTSTVGPICLPKSVPNNGEGAITGWGSNATSQQFSSTLMQNNVTIFDLAYCASTYQNDSAADPISPKLQLCAGGLGRDFCRGDMGGPLMMNFTDTSGVKTWYAVGLASFNPSSGCNRGTPSVYTNVAQYYTWIIDGINILS